MTNRKEQRHRRKEAGQLSKAIKGFAKRVIALSPSLQEMDVNLPNKEKKKKFTNRARKLISKGTVKVPKIITRNRMGY